MIMERERTRRHQERTVAENQPAALEGQAATPLVELRPQPPTAHVAVRGRAVEMIGLPSVIPSAHPADEQSDR